MKRESIYFVRVERQSVNDLNYDIVELLVPDGASVTAGAAIASVEGTKATFEIVATAKGFIRFAAQAGTKIEIGAVLAQISADPDQPLSIPPAEESQLSPAAGAGWEARFTRKAWALVEENKLDPTLFDYIDLVVESDVKRVLGGPARVAPLLDNLSVSTEKSMERIAILGAGQGCIQLLDILLRCPHQILAGLYDDRKHGTDFRLFGMAISGKIDAERILEDYQAGLFDKLVISIASDIQLRARIFDNLAVKGIPFANIIHPNVSEGIGASKGQGNVICSRTTLGPQARLGNNNFVSAYCNIEHHCLVGDHNTFGPGVMFSGSVQIGSRVRFGTGIFIERNISVGNDSIIASGAIIVNDIAPRTLVKTQSRVVLKPLGG